MRSFSTTFLTETQRTTEARRKGKNRLERPGKTEEWLFLREQLEFQGPGSLGFSNETFEL
jgi:hypothetical protein